MFLWQIPLSLETSCWYVWNCQSYILTSEVIGLKLIWKLPYPITYGPDVSRSMADLVYSQVFWRATAWISRRRRAQSTLLNWQRRTSICKQQNHPTSSFKVLGFIFLVPRWWLKLVILPSIFNLSVLINFCIIQICINLSSYYPTNSFNKRIHDDENNFYLRKIVYQQRFRYQECNVILYFSFWSGYALLSPFNSLDLR